MEEVLVRTAHPWVKPARRLTDAEIEEIIETYDYDPAYDQDEDREPEPVYDEYGNPTRDTVSALYESRHGIGDETTLNDMLAWIDGLK